MNTKTNSADSDWITSAVIKKLNESGKVNTTYKLPEAIYKNIVLNLKKDEKSRWKNESKIINDLNEIIFKQRSPIEIINSSTLDWEAAKNEIFSSLNWDDLQIGEPVEAEHVISEIIKETSSIEMMNWLNQLYLENSSNILLLCTLLHALSHIDYEKIFPAGPMMVVASLSHNDKRVVSYAIKTFSNWNSKESLKYAKDFSPKQNWAKREWDTVLKYILENGDEINGFFDETNFTRTVDTRSA